MSQVTIGMLKRLSLYMAGQLASAVAITGGTISGTSLGNASTRSGTFTATGTSPVTVANANVTANSIIIPTLKTVGGTVGALPAVKTITPTTGFTIAATASDTSVYNYTIIESA